jgi:DNA-binding transcriptional regulator YdaS (Cro superfamily)
VRLRKWVKDVGGKAAAAKLIGCHPSYLVHLLAEGSERRPGLDVAFGLERATREWAGGVIEAEEWSQPLDATGTEG